MKKILALVLALLVAMSMTAVFAADLSGESGKIGEFTDAANAAAQGNTVTLYKELLAINPVEEDAHVYAPAITYGYTIAPTTDAANSEITDTQGVKATVKPGLSGATITSSVSWTTEEKLNTSATGASNRKPIEVSFAGVTWTGAGVYRYTITETAPNYDASSVTQGDTSHTRYMDVYVRDTADGYEIYGYVCFSVNDDITATEESSAEKTEGFVNPSGSTSDDKAADKYYTYDIELTKTVVNDRAMEGHEWPFTVTFMPATGVTAANIKLDTEVDNATLGSGYAGALSGDTPKIKHEGSAKYIGIPYGTSVTIKETVDVAGTTYKVTSEGADTNINDASITGTTAGEDSSNATLNAQTTTDLENKTVAVTNEMLLISPTGVVLRVAPYIAMMIAGLALLIVARKRRSSKNED